MMVRRRLKDLVLAIVGAIILLLLLLPKKPPKKGAKQTGVGVICAKGYLEKLEEIKAGRLTHPNVSFYWFLIILLFLFCFICFSIKEVVSPSENHINIGMIMVTLEDVRQHCHQI